MQLYYLCHSFYREQMGQKEICRVEEFNEKVNAFRLSRIILTAFELDIFTVLGNNILTSADVAVRIQADPRATDRLLNALVAGGMLKKEDGMFANTVFSARHLVKGAPNFLSGLYHTANLWETWSTLTDAVRAGRSVTERVPLNLRDQAWSNHFIAAMHNRGVPQAKEVADVLDLKQVRLMLDVGGGSGAFTFEFLRRNPFMHAVVLDLPRIIPLTREYIGAFEGADRVSSREGDYLETDFGGEYDLILMSAIIHINSPEENAKLIRKAMDALNPGGQLVILDHIMDNTRTEPVVGAMFAINMLVGTERGDTYTTGELTQWMKYAGFRNIHQTDTVSKIQLLIGRK
ncbi:MAG: methyltransferase [Bacteroidetes bacterium]|nr:methyltransferase [Bacteroidota bacterium]